MTNPPAQGEGAPVADPRADEHTAPPADHQQDSTDHALPAPVPQPTGFHRAIVLVPGLETALRDEKRDQLVASLSMNDAMPVEEPTDGKIEGATFKRLTPDEASAAKNRPTVDVFEAYWTDLAFATQQPSPVKRFLQATELMIFWFFHPWWLRLSRQSASLFLSIMVTAVLMLLWYVTVVTALASFALQQHGGAAEPPDSSGSGDAGTSLIGFAAEKLQPFFQFVDNLAGTEVFALLVLVLAALNIGALIEIPRFVRDYLQPGRTKGLDMVVIERVQQTLKHVYEHVDATGAPIYQEVVLVGHSMGGAVALEALSGWGNQNVRSRTTLVTWGSPLAVLSARNPQRVGLKVQQAFTGDVPRWVDVYSDKDWMSGALDGHSDSYPDEILRPEFTASWMQGISAAAHNQYYYNDETLSLLLMPRISVTELKRNQNNAHSEGDGTVGNPDDVSAPPQPVS